MVNERMKLCGMRRCRKLFLEIGAGGVDPWICFLFGEDCVQGNKYPKLLSSQIGKGGVKEEEVSSEGMLLKPLLYIHPQDMDPPAWTSSAAQF